MSENTNESRLPPPAFPPGMRRRGHTNLRDTEAADDTGGSDATLIAPDDPMPERPDTMGGALISPDEPIPERKIELLEEFQHPLDGIDPDEEGQVVGMDHDPHLEPGEIISGGDPHVLEVMESVEKLAYALQHRGEAGLRATLAMSRFDATLRSYCVGYLAGRRAEDPPVPIVDEPLPTDG